MSAPSGFEVLEILALQGKDLPNKDYWKKQDPFLQYEIGSQLKRTRVDKKGGRNPEWNQRTRFDRLRAPVSGNMKVKCYDDDLIGKPKFIGECVIDLSEIYSEGDMDNWFTLYDAGEKAGQIYLELTFYANDGVTRRRKVLDDEKRANRRKTKGSRSGSEDSLASQIDKLELVGPPVNPIKHELKPEPKVETNTQPTPSKEASIPKPQEPAPTAPQPTNTDLAQNQHPSASVSESAAQPLQVNTSNVVAQEAVISSNNPVTTSPTSISHPAPVSLTASTTTSNTASTHAPPPDQSKAAAETVLQNQPITSAPHATTTANPIANPVISNIKSDSISSISSQQTTSTPIQITPSPVVAPVLTSEPVTTSSVSSIPSNPSPIVNANNQQVNQQTHVNSTDSGHTQAAQNPQTHSNSMNSSTGSQPSTYADNAASASPYPQISAPKPFTYGSVQPAAGSQPQHANVAQQISNDHTQVQPALVANPVTTQPAQTSHEQIYNNVSQPSNQGINPNPVPAPQINPTQQHPTEAKNATTSPSSVNPQSQIRQDAAQIQPMENYPANTNPAQPINHTQAHSAYEAQSPTTSHQQNQNIANQPAQVSQQHSINPAVNQSYPSPQSSGQQSVAQSVQVSQPQSINTVTSQAYPPVQSHVSHVAHPTSAQTSYGSQQSDQHTLSQQPQSNPPQPAAIAQTHQYHNVQSQTYPPVTASHPTVTTQPTSTQAPCGPQQLNQHAVSQHPHSNPPQPAVTAQANQYHNAQSQTYPPATVSHPTLTTQPTSTQAPCGPQQLNQHVVSQHPHSNLSQPTVTTQPQQYPNAQPQAYPPVGAPHPQQHSGHSHSNSISSTNSYQSSIPATHQYPPQSYPTPPGVNTYSPPTAHQHYPPAPYPPSQPYPTSSYGGYPSTNEAHYNPYPQPQEAGPRPLFPSVADHVYDQAYQQSHFTPYPVRQDSYPQPPSHVSPTGSQYYPPGPPDTYSSYNSTSYHRPTSFPSFPSVYSDNTSSPPPLPNKPVIPDTYVMETPPPLPSRPPTVSFPILQTNNTSSPPPLPPNLNNQPLHQNQNQNQNQNQAYGSSGIPYGSQSEGDKKKNKSDLDKLKKMFKQFI